MLAVLSPAKNLDFSPADHPKATAPALRERTAELAAVAKRLKPRDLKTLMGVSDKLAELNVERFASFDPEQRPSAGFPAALAFAGDVYRGLEARSLSGEDLAWAQKNVRILSGLYGLLRPLDAIQPYRLEMGAKLKTKRGGTLYEFWGADIAEALNTGLRGHQSKTIVNLASNEYFNAVDRSALKADVISPVFKDVKDGKARVLFVFAKRARGLMARWIVENRIEEPADLRRFKSEGYRFSAAASDDGAWVFERPQPAKKAA
ncbi:MAG: peroxide stress protein YaaA [Caulobacterales bacterium]|nr:peroxide stress protein YaaA [Caulobacterales bacterium]